MVRRMRAFPWIRFAGLTVMAALALAACGGEATKDLVPLSGDGFEVSMPGKPVRSEQSISTAKGTIKAVSYRSDSSDTPFSIGYTELPKGVEGDLRAAIPGAAAKVGGTVKDEQDATYQGFKARDARITGAADDKSTLFVRVILAKGRLYVLQYIGEGRDLKTPPEAYTEIINSLKIG